MDVAGSRHCSLPNCRELDFLPFECNCCKKVFCQRHFAYQAHNCTQAAAASVQVILCPLCDNSIRIKPEEDPNLTWETHFIQSCAKCKSSKPKKNKCPVPGCKEILSLSNKYECQRCGSTVCLKHRSEFDHPCTPCQEPASKGNASNRTASAPAGRRSQGSGNQASPPRPPQAAPQSQFPPHPQQGSRMDAQRLSEDERLARMLQEQEIAYAAQGGGDIPGGGGGAEERQGLRSGRRRPLDRFMSLFACFRPQNGRRSSSTPSGRGGRR